MSRSTILRLSCLAIVVLIVGCSALAYIAYQVISYPFGGYSWSLNEINKLFTVPIPQDAIDVVYSGHMGLGAHLDLEFKAPPASADQFATAVCKGGLYVGYDPFQSINIGEPFTYAHPMQIGIFTYYSYSPDTPLTVSGNRCGLEYQIREDKTNPNVYKVKAQVHFTCNAICSPVPFNAIEPTDKFPIEVLGLQEAGNRYQMTSSELCVGIRSGLFAPGAVRLLNFAGAQLQVLIDTKLTASADVDSENNLVQRSDGQGQSVTLGASGSLRYYCFRVNWDKDAHMLEVRLKTNAAEHTAYTWTFSADAPQSTPDPSPTA